MSHNNGWISTKQRLPDIGQRFDGWVHGQLVNDCGAYVGSWEEEARRETMLIKGISHWKPISDGPKFDWRLCDQKINGSCPHHNLHCNYPDCEQKPL